MGILHLDDIEEEILPIIQKKAPPPSPPPLPPVEIEVVKDEIDKVKDVDFTSEPDEDIEIYICFKGSNNFHYPIQLK